MCGIAGIIHRDKLSAVERATVRRMCDAIAHRGPDDEGFYVEGRAGLGMRRLSIIDLAHGQQPMMNEDSSLHLVFNGEIYNYRELRGELIARGHVFQTESDTETIIHAYEEYGDDFLSRLRGMFAVALWDERREQLTLAVDRFGIKPLYYAADERGIVFGSELKCLEASRLISKEIDYDALAEYFTLGYIPPPATIYRSVRKLAPASVLRWTPREDARIETYWRLPAEEYETEESATLVRKRLRAALRDAVASHLMSDVPVGAFLSGGIDSGSIVALMSECGAQPIRTFTVGFKEREHSETELARLVARKFRTEHHEIIIELETVEILPELVSAFDEPFADSSALPTYYVSKAAREFVKVALSGDGGDELFLGYNYFRGLELARQMQRLPAAVRRALAAAPALLPRTSNAARNDKLARFRKRVADTMLAPTDSYRSKIRMPGLDAALPLLSEELRDKLLSANPYAAVDRALEENLSRNSTHQTHNLKTHPLAPFIHAGLKVSLAGDMLVKVDRMSMKNSLEVRVPLLDHVLAEQVARLPVAQRLSRGKLKGLLRETMADALPPEILRAPKHGFTVPLAAWFRGDLAAYAEDALLNADARASNFYDANAIKSLLAEHRSGRRDVGALVWSLLVFELWRKRSGL